MLTHEIHIEACYEDQRKWGIGIYKIFYNAKNNSIQHRTFFTKKDKDITPNTALEDIKDNTSCEIHLILKRISVTLNIKKDNLIIASFYKNHPYKRFSNKNISLKDIYNFYESFFKKYPWNRKGIKTFFYTQSPFPNFQLTYQHQDGNIEKEAKFTYYLYCHSDKEYYNLEHPICSYHAKDHTITIETKNTPCTTLTLDEASNVLRNSFKRIIKSNDYNDIFTEHEKMRIIKDINDYSYTEFLQRACLNEAQIQSMQKAIDSVLNRIPKKQHKT